MNKKKSSDVLGSVQLPGKNQIIQNIYILIKQGKLAVLSHHIQWLLFIEGRENMYLHNTSQGSAPRTDPVLIFTDKKTEVPQR